MDIDGFGAKRTREVACLIRWHDGRNRRASECACGREPGEEWDSPIGRGSVATLDVRSPQSRGGMRAIQN